MAQKAVDEKLSHVEIKKNAIKERRERLNSLSALLRAARAEVAQLNSTPAAWAFSALERAVAAFEEIRTSYAPEFDHLRLQKVFFGAVEERFSGVFCTVEFEGIEWLEVFFIFKIKFSGFNFNYSFLKVFKDFK